MLKAKKALIVSLCLLLFVLSLFTVNAETNANVNGDIFPTWCAQPPASDFMGYLEVLYQDQTTNKKYVRVFMVTFSSDFNGASDFTSPVRVSFLGDTVKFQYNRRNGNVYTSLCITHFYTDYKKSYTVTRSLGEESSELMDTWSWNYDESYREIIGYHIYGDIFTAVLGGNSVSNNSNFTVLYSGDSVAYQMLAEILKQQQEKTEEFVNKQEELQEKEKEEAEETGDGGVKEIIDAIPDKTDDLKSSFSVLTNSFVTDTTSAKLTFPGIKIPALKPFTNREIVLLGESEIDFAEYIEMIPPDILSLVRALGTITIVVFCFRELYTMLAFIFTAKGRDDIE